MKAKGKVAAKYEELHEISAIYLDNEKIVIRSLHFLIA